MAWLEREDLTQWAEKSKRNPRKLDTMDRGLTPVTWRGWWRGRTCGGRSRWRGKPLVCNGMGFNIKLSAKQRTYTKKIIIVCNAKGLTEKHGGGGLGHSKDLNL